MCSGDPMLHIENEDLAPLIPFFRSHIQKGLNAIQISSKIFNGEVKESYAFDICARVSEIDNAFQGLKISLEYLNHNEFGNSKYDFTNQHSFHIENFLLRLTSIVDRSYLLVGTSILLEKKSIEKLGGKKKIKKALRQYPPDISNALNTIEKAVGSLRKIRNEVAHQSGYSSNNLSALILLETFGEAVAKKLDKTLPLPELKALIISDSLNLFEPVLGNLNVAVTKTIGSLSFIYQGLRGVD